VSGATAPVIRTLSGDLAPEQLGPCLTHEHLAIDMRRPADGPHAPVIPGYGSEGALVEALLPAARALAAAGVAAIVECTPPDLGQRPAVYRAVAQAVGLAVIACAGTYRHDWLPPWVAGATDEQVAARYFADLEAGCGAIKLGCDSDGPSDREARCARAAGRVSRATGVFVACHVERDGAAHGVLVAFEAGGGDPARFAVVHCQEEPDPGAHLALARRGAWLSYDRIGGRLPDDAYVRLVLAATGAGHGAQVLVAQDAPAYIVGQDGAARLAPPARLTHRMTRFRPPRRAPGANDALVRQLLVANPRRALAFTPGGGRPRRQQE
jgi:phosphotriesterase-related protein